MNKAGRLLMMMAAVCTVTTAWADNGPSLSVTMKFIQEKLNNEGQVNYVFTICYIDNKCGSENESDSLANVVANPSTCIINYQMVRDNGGVNNRNHSLLDKALDLRLVKRILVQTLAQSWTKQSGRNGENTFQTDPEIFQVFIPDQATIFLFKDQDTANRVAKALTHSVELCGGGEKEEPF